MENALFGKSFAHADSINVCQLFPHVHFCFNKNVIPNKVTKYVIESEARES